VGTKSAVQIRSHAQKFFAKHGSGEGGQPTTVVVPGADGGTESISIPPPRPKRKPSQPLPRKAPPPVAPSIQSSIPPSAAPPPPAATPKGDQAVMVKPVAGHKRGPPAPVVAPFPKARRSRPGGNSAGGHQASPAPSGGTTAAGGAVAGRNISRGEPLAASALRSALTTWPIGSAPATHAIPSSMLLDASALFGCGPPGGQEGGGVGAHADGGFGPHIMQFMAHQQQAFATAAALAAGAAAAARRAVTAVAPVGGSPDHNGSGSGGAATDAADGGCLVPAPPPLAPLDTAAMAAWATAAAYGPAGGQFFMPTLQGAHQPMGPPLGFGDAHAGSLRGTPLLVNFAMEGKGYSRNGGPQADTDGAECRDGPSPPGGSGGTSSSGAQSGQDGKGQPSGEVAAGGGAAGAAGGGLSQPNGSSEDEVEGLRGVPPTGRALAAASGPQAPTLLGPPTAHPHRSAQGHALAKHQAMQAARLAAATAAAAEQQQQQQQAHLVMAAMQHAQHHGAVGGEQAAQAQPRLLPVASPSSAFSTFNRIPSARSLSGAAVAAGSGSVGGWPAAPGLGPSRHLAAVADPALQLFAASLGPTDAATAALWQHHAAAASAMAQWTTAAAALWGAAPTPAGFAAFQPPLHAGQHGAVGSSQRHEQHSEPVARTADEGAAAQPHAAAKHAPRPTDVAVVAAATAAADDQAQPEGRDAPTVAQLPPPPSDGLEATAVEDKEAGAGAAAHTAAGADVDAAAAHAQQQQQHVRRAVSPGSSSGDEPTVRHGHTNARVTAADEAVAAQERRERGTGDVSGGDNSGGDETGDGGSGDGQGTNRGSNGGTGNRSSSGDGGSREGSEQRGDRLCKGEGGDPGPGVEAVGGDTRFVTSTDRQ
jgi:hypothetical protein